MVNKSQNIPILINPDASDQKQINRELVESTKQIWKKISQLSNDMETIMKEISLIKLKI